jgi:hypothetical protein
MLIEGAHPASAYPHARPFLREAGVMHIHFPQESPEYCGRDLVIVFPALVDGKPVQCAITAEALEEHFGALSLREGDLLSAFDSHRRAIEHEAQRMLVEVGGRPVLLHGGCFRFAE